MNLPTEVFGDVVVVHTTEEVSGDHADNLHHFLVSRDHWNIVADLDDTESIDSEGLAMLLDVQEELVEMGGNLKIATTNHVNRKILEMTRLDQQLEVFESVVDAVKSFQQVGSS